VQGRATTGCVSHAASVATSCRATELPSLCTGHTRASSTNRIRIARSGAKRLATTHVGTAATNENRRRLRCVSCTRFVVVGAIGLVPARRSDWAAVRRDDGPDPTMMSQSTIRTIPATGACPKAVSNRFYGEFVNVAQMVVACERIRVLNTCAPTGAQRARQSTAPSGEDVLQRSQL
jgi:hypothetical protein